MPIEIRRVSSKISRAQVRSLLIRGVVWIYFLLLNYQTVTVFGTLESPASVKPYHLFAIAIIPLVLIRRRLPIPHPLILLFFLIVTVSSIIAYPFTQFNSLLINYAFAFYTFYLALAFGRVISRKSQLAIVRSASLVVFGGVLIKLLLHWDAVQRFFSSPFGHPILPFFYGGGPNLEATWVALSSAFFLGHRLFYPITLLSLLLSALYSSRVAFIVSLIFLLYPLIPHPGRTLMRSVPLGLSLALALAALFILISDSYILERFASIGSDPGSLGRLRIWTRLDEALLANPFGHGAGNGIIAIEGVTNTGFWETNVHNYFAQVFLDFGIVGLFVYLVMLGGLLWKEFAEGFRSPFGAYLIAFSIAGLVQFRGAEPIAWFVAGLYVSTIRRPCSPLKEPRKSQIVSKR
jgi:putative inorganic carbon (HCO3(-)) transporter